MSVIIGRSVIILGGLAQKMPGIFLGFVSKDTRVRAIVENLHTGKTEYVEPSRILFGFKEEREKYKKVTEYCPLCKQLKQKENVDDKV